MALTTIFGSDVLEMIHKSKVLVIGAGGIGCELLKNLVSSGFKDIETIDLDTIEVSNLNRQFLFRKDHVGKSKAKTAADSVKQFDSSISIKGHLGNIKSSEFDSDYFNKFDIVLNALDNTEARRHVNRLCLSTKKPFVESGTQGFVGQVIPIIPTLTQCWECTPKQSNNKTYPVCTIRSTPDKAVHCIVWAKLIFALLFGADDDSNIIKDLKVEMKENEDINTFIYLFEKDIEEQISMADKWKNRQPPITIKYNEIETVLSIEENVMRVLSVEENVKLFLSTMNKLFKRKKECGELVFDKDDDLAMRFVSCAANLRMYCYHIECISQFDTKGIAGNIIHAIATTNAIVAGAMVVQAIHILKRNNELKTRVCWVQSNGRKWLYPQNMESPNNECFICQKSILHLTLNPNLFNFGVFLEKILKKHLGFIAPDITIECPNQQSNNYIESITQDDDEEMKEEKEVLYGKDLDDPMIKIYDASNLSIEDFNQDVTINLMLHYLKLNQEKHVNGFEITNEWRSDMFTVDQNNHNISGKKRKEMDSTDNDMVNEPPLKKLKT